MACLSQRNTLAKMEDMFGEWKLRADVLGGQDGQRAVAQDESRTRRSDYPKSPLNDAAAKRAGTLHTAYHRANMGSQPTEASCPESRYEASDEHGATTLLKNTYIDHARHVTSPLLLSSHRRTEMSPECRMQPNRTTPQARAALHRETRR